MAASIRNSILRNVTISAVQPPAGASEWWGFLGQTDAYDQNGGGYDNAALNDWLVYRRLVERDSGGAGAVVSDTVDTNSTPPSTNWTPVGSTPSPTLVAFDLPNGVWEIDMSAVLAYYDTFPVKNPAPPVGGTFVIIGPGTQEYIVTFSANSNPDISGSWSQVGTQ